MRIHSDLRIRFLSIISRLPLTSSVLYSWTWYWCGRACGENRDPAAMLRDRKDVSFQSFLCTKLGCSDYFFFPLLFFLSSSPFLRVGYTAESAAWERIAEWKDSFSFPRGFLSQVSFAGTLWKITYSFPRNFKNNKIWRKSIWAELII